MNNLIEVQNNLPTSAEDLSRFILIGTEKLKAVKAEIAAIDKLELAEEVRKQKLTEAQDISDAVQLASVQVGKILKAIPKASGGDRRSENFKNPSGGNFEKTKSEAAKDMGLDKNQVSQFQQMADHEEIVKQALQEARSEGEIPNRAFIMSKIKEAEETHRPHVSFNSGNNEWYTPKEFIDAARLVMGTIDLDPASSEIANETVQAEKIYTADDNGLACPWFGNVWLNPPYSSDLIGQFAEKVKAKEYNQAIVLVNNATETAWFADIVSVASAIVFPTSRVKFYKPDGSTGAPLQGQAILYVGDNPAAFLSEFEKFGWGVRHELHRRE